MVAENAPKYIKKRRRRAALLYDNLLSTRSRGDDKAKRTWIVVAVGN